MSTRACYRFIDPDTSDPEVVTIYKHSDGYPDGAVCRITRALEHAWPLGACTAREITERDVDLGVDRNDDAMRRLLALHVREKSLLLVGLKKALEKCHNAGRAIRA